MKYEEETGTPLLMASGIETLRGIVVVKVLSLKFLRTSWEISSPSFVRESNLVRRIPSISSFGLSPLWTEAIVERSCAKASSAKYSHCLGMMTLSAARNIILKNTTLVVFFCAIKCNLCYYYIVILWSMLRTSVIIAMRGSSLVYKRNK